MNARSGRRLVAFALVAGSLVVCGTGCKTGGTWGMPSWPRWGSWGGASSPDSTALNITKPSTQAPAPVTTPGQPSRSLAAGGNSYPSGVAATGGAGAAGPASGVYPATAQADAYPGRAANTWQPGAESGGQVAPAGGYQVGPYSMQTNAAPPPASGYAAGRTGTGAPAPSTGAASGPYAPANEPAPEGNYGGTEGYRTATPAGSSAGGNTWNSGGQNPAEENGAAAGQPGSVYSGDGAGSEPSLYGPSSTGAATEGVPSSSATSPAPGYGPPNTVAPGSTSVPRRPSTSPPAASASAPAAPSTLPASLTTAGGFRPGSTASPGSRFGSENAGYDQTHSATASGNDPSYGNSYTR